MNILINLTYYRPHTSGLTIYVERLAKAFVQLGHRVTILTSRYERTLQKTETRDGVKIIRVPVLFRISKGVVMPTLVFYLIKEFLRHDVIHIHLPQFDAAAVAFWSRLLHKPTILTYHCDLIMPRGLLNWLANQAVHLMNRIAAVFAHRIVTYTQDYANHSVFLRHYLKKLDVIKPPVQLPEVTPREIEEFQQRTNATHKRPVIGMAARFATEKGVEVLIKALPIVRESHPAAVIQFAGPHEQIVGEEQYAKKLMPAIRDLEKQQAWRFLGILNEKELTKFYANIDLLVVPSLNSTEAFGLVQIEAMLMGKPIVVSDLPGVRQPVQWHHMGEVVAVGDPKKLGQAILGILQDRERYRIEKEELDRQYSPEAVAKEYIKLFQRVAEGLQ